MLKYGFFDSLDNDRTYTSSDVAFLNSLLMSNGVYCNPSTSLQVVTDSEMNVKIKPGTAVINGRYCTNDSEYTTSVYYAGDTLTRYTCIVLRLNLANRLFEVAKIWADSTLPALTRDSNVYELCLATIAVPVGATAVTQAMITDNRGDNVLCGWLTGAVNQIDTTDLFAQYDAEWDLLKTQYRTVAKDPTILENYALKANVFEAGTTFGTTQITNVNTVAKSGWYYALSSATGVPSYDYNWLVNHIQGVDTNTAVQIACARVSGIIRVYTRTKVNGAWQSWFLLSPMARVELYNGSVSANTSFNLSDKLSNYSEIGVRAISNTNYVSYMRVPVATFSYNGYTLFDTYNGADSAALLFYLNSTYSTLRSTVALNN